MNRSDRPIRGRRWLAAMTVVLAGGTGIGVHAPSVGAAPDRVVGGFAGGQPIELDADGGWSWFEGPRVLATACEVLAGSVSSAGDVEVSSLDLRTGDVVSRRVGGADSNDHNSPGLFENAAGQTVAAWSRHNQDKTMRNLVRPSGASEWSAMPSTVLDATTTYANLHRAPDGSLYNFTRLIGGPGIRIWNSFLTSQDDGRTWTERTDLFVSQGQRPYLVFDDRDGRIDIAATQAHPRELDGASGMFSNIYHGYLGPNGGLYGSAGNFVVPAGTRGTVTDFLDPVYISGQGERAWTQDIASSESPSIVFSVRNRSLDQNWYGFARWDGTEWTTHRIADAGSSLYAAEDDYTGGIAIDPTDPDHVVLSTDVHPTTGQSLAAHQLFDGSTTNGGRTWRFEAITPNATLDNLRPDIVVSPDGATVALAWVRGVYTDYLNYDLSVQAIVDTPSDTSSCPERAVPALDATSFVGDFDGDGRADHFTYGPGSAPDIVVFGNGRRADVNVSGSYNAQVSSAPGRADRIVWDNAAVTYEWAWNGSGFVSTTMPKAATVRVVVGDWDGDGADDLLHYRPGPLHERVYLSAGPTYIVNVGGTYTPFVGDWNGDGRDDLFWYAPGPAPDYQWISESTSFRSVYTPVGGAYRPAVGDLDADGRDDIRWSAGTGDLVGPVWMHQADGSYRDGYLG